MQTTLSCAMRNREHGAREKPHQELLSTAHSTHDPLSTSWGSSTAPKATVDSWLCSLQPHRDKGIFLCHRDFIHKYILFVRSHSQ